MVKRQPPLGLPMKRDDRLRGRREMLDGVETQAAGAAACVGPVPQVRDGLALEDPRVDRALRQGADRAGRAGPEIRRRFSLRFPGC